MRMLEILIVTAIFVTLAGYFIRRTSYARKITRFLPTITLLLILLHLLIDKYRWQMMLVYALAVILFIASVFQFARGKPASQDTPTTRGRKVLTGVTTVAGLVILGISGFLFISFPVVKLPQPTGPYTVGTAYIQFLDESRPETLTSDPDDIRQVTGRIWYPAKRPDMVKPVPYQDYQPSVGSLASAGGAPEFIFSHFHLGSSNSYLDAPISPDQPSYPVLIFSIGFMTLFEDYQVLTEELASHGYIVLCLDTPYEWQSVVQPDGSVEPFSEEHGAAYDQHMTDIIPLWEQFWSSSDNDERVEIVDEILSSETFMDTILRIRVADIQHAIDELERMNNGEVEIQFTGRLDLSRLGVIGHSMGGAVAGQTCLVDERFGACVNLDGFQWGDVVDNQIHQTVMIISSEQNEGSWDYLFSSLDDTSYLLTIKGTQHMNFQDTGVVMPGTKTIGMVGPIQPRRSLEITSAYLLAFFDQYLRGDDTALLSDVSAEYPEVIIEIINP